MINYKISVAMGTYNGERYIGEQLESILQQTVKVHEIVICDDCSSDSTISIVQQYAENNPEISWIIVKNEENLKTIKNFEKALSLCTGDWIFLCDQDDIWVKDKIKKMTSFVQNHPKTLLLFTNGDLIDSDGQKIHGSLWEKWGFDIEARQKWTKNRNALKNLINNKNYVTGATVLLNRNLLKFALPIIVPPGMYHDCFLALHAARKNQLCFLEENLILYRIHSMQQMGVSMEGKNNESVLEKTEINSDQFVKHYTNMYLLSSVDKIKIFIREILKLLKLT